MKIARHMELTIAQAGKREFQEQQGHRTLGKSENVLEHLVKQEGNWNEWISGMKLSREPRVSKIYNPKR